MTDENQNQKQTPEVNAELAKQLGKAALKGGVDAITGKKDTSMLNSIVIGIRILGVVLVFCAVFQLWFFEWMAMGMKFTGGTSSFVIWLKVTGIGLVFGMLVYGIAEVVVLLQRIEGHLRKLAEART